MTSQNNFSFQFLINTVTVLLLIFKRISPYPADTDVFKTSSGRLKEGKTSYNQTRCRQDLYEEDVRFTTSWRRLIYDVFKMSGLRRPEDARLRHLEVVQFTTSWRRLIYDVSKTSNMWRLEDLCKTTSL